MIYITLTLITALVIFTVAGFKNNWRNWSMNPKQLLSIAALLWLVPACIAQVPTGHTGIITTFGKVENTTLESGVHFKLPYQEVVVMDNRTQLSRIELLSFSSDIQEVQVAFSINYRIEKQNAQLIYKTIGVNYYETVMQPKIEVAVKSVIAKHTAENLISTRETLSEDIQQILIDELKQYNIEIVNTSLENLDFSDAFTQAVEDKQVAQQELLKAKTEQEQKTMEQEKAAERDVIAANAAAEVAEIQAKADAKVIEIQAEAAAFAGQKDAAINEAISSTLTELLVKYYEIKQWDGKLPNYYVSGVDTVLPILGSAGGSASVEN